jgi:hypothetical protein
MQQVMPRLSFLSWFDEENRGDIAIIATMVFEKP